MASKLEQWADKIVEQVIDGELTVNDGIEKIEERMQGYEILKQRRDRLAAARRALLGVGSRTTANAGTRITQDEVAQVLQQFEDGATVNDLMGKMSGATDGQIRGHLNRGKGERFLQKGGKWYLRDPEAGINTEEDIDD